MNELSSARACRYSSLTGPGSDASRGDGRDASAWAASILSAAESPCSAAKTSFEISVCTAIRSSEATWIAPPERTLCAPTSSSCQFRSNPFSARRKLPASTNDTSRRWPTESGSICAMGSDISVLDGRTTRAGIRASRAAIASASAYPYSGATSVAPRFANGSTTSEFCGSLSPADSRKRSASIERMPVDRFSASAFVVGRLAAASPGITPVSNCNAFMIVFSASRTSAAEVYRAAGFFSRHAAITLLNSGDISATTSLRSGGSENWIARIA